MGSPTLLRVRAGCRRALWARLSDGIGEVVFEDHQERSRMVEDIYQIDDGQANVERHHESRGKSTSCSFIIRSVSAAGYR